MVGEVCVIAPCSQGQDTVLRGCGDADIYSTTVLEREDSYDNCLLTQDNNCIDEEVPVEYAASIDSEVTAEGEYESPDDDADAFLAVEDSNSTEVVFVREGVSVWPTRHESIKGRLSLIKQHCVLFLSWLPYSNGALQDDGTFLLDMERELQKDASLPKDCSMYAIHPIPLSDIKAIRRHTPALGWHYIAVVLVSGLTLPPLYFNQGGVKAFFKSLKQHCFLAKSSEDPTTYLVNDISDPLQRSLTSLELTDILLGAPPLNASCTFAPEGSPPGAHWAEPEQTWKGLAAFSDTFSRITHQLRDTTSSWFAGGHWSPDDCPSLPELQSFPSEDVEVVERPKDSNNSSSSAVNIRNLKRCRSGWKNGEAAAAGDETEASTSVGSFELVGQMMQDDIAAARRRPRPPPLNAKEFGTFLDSEGRLVDVAGFRERVFYSGLAPELRREGWKFLLGVHPAGGSAAERNEAQAKRAAQYEELRQQWLSIGQKQAARFSKWRERKMRVDKDVRRTDRAHAYFAGEHNSNLRALRRVLLTYTMYNFDLGYCQGMSDLAAPLLYVSRDEGEAFWLYSALMDRMEGNFHVDQRGMHAQLLALRKLLQVLDPQLYSFLETKECLNLFFCFRWILIHFKREFSWDDVLRLWEAIWACPLTPHLHLYLCTAVLIHHRRSIMENDFEFDELLKFCIELSGHMDLDHLLRLAEALCRYAGEAGKECLAGLDDALSPQPFV